MTENTQERQFSIQRIYTKDISFETPNTPEIFMQEWKPQVNVNLNNAVKDLGEGNLEVALTVTVTAKIEDKTAFLVEVTQAGIFLARGIPEEEMGPLLGVYCPNVLFPYVRETVSDLITRGSFPQFLLAPVNFEALYAQQMQQQQESPEKVEH
ncbi:MAG: protein-export chaperone SecB [Gammaproteobacteria bacterium]|nr:MAG: protein-export chaperone SecB [Gammaproteobacteria bacterium]RTZ73988.1 MAG: protein-export chaperone SecB [Gammaproteobacteria bacterium]